MDENNIIIYLLFIDIGNDMFTEHLSAFDTMEEAVNAQTELNLQISDVVENVKLEDGGEKALRAIPGLEKVVDFRLNECYEWFKVYVEKVPFKQKSQKGKEKSYE